METGILQEVHKLVEANYINGRPKHHLQAAYNVKHEDGASVFFIVSYEDFMKMSSSDINHIARRRHILVRGIPQEKFKWGREALAHTGSLTQQRDVQGKSA
jgi:hypothetical protein